MSVGRPHRPRLTQSMPQMMKLVIFAAAASACVTPFARLAIVGIGTWWRTLVWSAVAVPLVLAVVAFPVLRKGPMKDWLIRALLLVSVADALGFAIWSLVRYLYGYATDRVLISYVYLAESSGRVVLLGIAFIFLARGVILRWCPECRRPTLLSESTTVSRPREGRFPL